jgi:hypothetical protein
LKVAKEKHEEARKGLPSDVPDDIEEYVGFFYSPLTKADNCSRARGNLGHVIQPLIDGIRMYTRTSVTILMGSPPTKAGSSYYVKVLNSGTTTDTRTPMDFHNWDEQGFKTNVLQHFLRFLSHTFGMYFFAQRH